MESKDIKDDKKAYILHGKLHFKVDMEVTLEERFTGGSRETTGCVGIENEVRML